VNSQLSLQPDLSGLPLIARAVSLADIPAAEWNSVLPDPRQDWAHFNRIAATAVAGRKTLCFEVRAGGALRALVPAFIVEGDAAQGSWHWLRRLYHPRVLVLGSPLEETCPLGLAADVTDADKRELLIALLRCADAFAKKSDCDILVIKHAADAADELWTRACVPLHLHRLADISILGSALCGHRVADTSNWCRSRVSWFRWSEAMFDSVCTIDLNEEEMTALMLKRPRNSGK
jgi:hypothetical protein